MSGEIKNPFKLEDGCQVSSRYSSFSNVNSLISGKEAKLAWANGDIVGYMDDGNVWFVDENTPLGVFDSFKEWQIKPRTISINGIEVPAPFEPKCMEDFYVIDGTHSQGWINGNPANPALSMGNPKWRTEEEIKQVVEALRTVFKGDKND